MHHGSATSPAAIVARYHQQRAGGQSFFFFCQPQLINLPCQFQSCSASFCIWLNFIPHFPELHRHTRALRNGRRFGEAFLSRLETQEQRAGYSICQRRTRNSLTLHKNSLEELIGESCFFSWVAGTRQLNPRLNPPDQRCVWFGR